MYNAYARALLAFFLGGVILCDSLLDGYDSQNCLDNIFANSARISLSIIDFWLKAKEKKKEKKIVHYQV